MKGAYHIFGVSFTNSNSGSFSDRCEAFWDGFESISNHFQMILFLGKKTNFNWPRLGPDPSRPASQADLSGPSPNNWIFSLISKRKRKQKRKLIITGTWGYLEAGKFTSTKTSQNNVLAPRRKQSFLGSVTWIIVWGKRKGGWSGKGKWHVIRWPSDNPQMAVWWPWDGRPTADDRRTATTTPW